MPKKKQDLSEEQAIELRQPFGYKIIANTDPDFLRRLVIRIAGGASITDEARFLSRECGESQAACRDFLKKTYGWTEQEYYDFLGRITRDINRKIAERLHKEVDDIPTKDLVKAMVALTNQSLTLDGRPTNISASKSDKIGEKSIEEVRKWAMAQAQVEKKVEAIDLSEE